MYLLSEREVAVSSAATRSDLVGRRRPIQPPGGRHGRRPRPVPVTVVDRLCRLLPSPESSVGLDFIGGADRDHLKLDVYHLCHQGLGFDPTLGSGGRRVVDSVSPGLALRCSR